jgi:hypothetical protein
MPILAAMGGRIGAARDDAPMMGRAGGDALRPVFHHAKVPFIIAMRIV